MLSRKSTTARKKGGIAAAALILLVCASARITSAVAADSGYALPVAAPLYSYLHEARAATPARSVGGAANGLSAALDASQSDLKASLHYIFGGDAALATDRTLQAEREVLVRNSDAFVRAKLRVTVVKDWRGFVYADMRHRLRVEVAGPRRRPRRPRPGAARRLAPRDLPLQPWDGTRLARFRRSVPRGDTSLVADETSRRAGRYGSPGHPRRVPTLTSPPSLSWQGACRCAPR